MKAFLHGIALQLKLDIRSRMILITFYLVPLIFFFFIGGIFTSINPDSRLTLIQSMTVFGITMGATIGLPPAIVEIYGSDIKNVYKANGVPLYLGIVTNFISSFIHLFVMSVIILIAAPIAFNAAYPANLPLYFCSLAVFIAVSLSIGIVLGLLCKSQSKLTMFSQLIFLPSIMLSGIMFPANMLPEFLQYISYILPATLGVKSMVDFKLWHLLAMAGIFAAMAGLGFFKLKRMSKQ